MLLHISILRSSSGSTYCSLLKLHVKIVNTSLYLSVMWQGIMCMCMRCFQCRGGGGIMHCRIRAFVGVYYSVNIQNARCNNKDNFVATFY